MGGAVESLAVISAIASVGGLGVNILGQRQQAQTAAAQARYRQQLASVHAGFREQDIKAEREREQVRQQLLARAEKQQREEFERVTREKKRRRKRKKRT